ncbi:MAG TPA: hypothetical protein VHE35_34830 [Kofleriaceae bacterium]|nr:hypothetical protein [Kofleriaceae bacterium]
MRFVLPAAVVLAIASCGDPADPDCLVRITEVNIDGDTMTVDGTFITAQPLLFVGGDATMVIPGEDDGRGHATFDLAGLPSGRFDYHFAASCYDENDSPTVEAPTGFFTRT